MNVDSTKKNPLIGALDVPAPASAGKTEGKTEKKSIDLEYAPSTGGSSAAKFFAASTAPSVTSLKGPGVSSMVFGQVPPDPRSMSVEDLAAGIAKLGNAMRANVGKLNDADLGLYRAMTMELGVKLANSVDVSKSPKTMDNGTLHASLLALDLQEASGAPLTKPQAEFRAKAQAEWKQRVAHDPTKDLARLEARREKLVHGAVLVCGSAAAGIAGMALHSPFVSGASAGLATYHAVHEGKYVDAAVEIALFGASFAAGTAAEGVAVTKGSLECLAAAYEVYSVGKEIEMAKQAIAKK